MTVSAIVCTRGRPVTVTEAVQCLTSQTRRPDEIIVVDQSDEPNERLLARRDITYVHDRQRGAPRAKNLGIEVSSGDLLLFLDDDTIAPPGLVAAHLANYTNGQTHVVAGRVLCPDDPPLGTHPRVGRMSMRDLSMTANFHATQPTDVDHVYGCNWSVRRPVLDAVGGFDEALQPDGRGTAYFEEAELSIRIRRAGYVIAFDPRAVAEHRKAPSGGCRPSSHRAGCYWFYRNKAVLFSRYCSCLWLPWFLARQLVSIARRAASAEARREGGVMTLVATCLRALWDGRRCVPFRGGRHVVER